MRGSLRLQLFAALVVPPVIVAGVLTAVAIQLFRQDKELYVYDLFAQTVDLVARDLSSKLAGLKARAQLGGPLAPPLLAVSHTASSGASPGAGVQIDNVSRGGEARLRIRYPGLEVQVRPEALLDLRGQSGGSQLMLISATGELLAHADQQRVLERRDLASLLARLRLFEPATPRVGTRPAELDGARSLVAFAKLPGAGAAVVQAIARGEVFAAARPLIKTAVFASAVMVGLTVLLALLLARVIIRPIRLMAEQAAAIARGELGVETEAVAGGDVGKLAQRLNMMSAALKRRDDELRQLHDQLMQAERLHAAGRMIAKVAKELAVPVETCFGLAAQTVARLPEQSDQRALQERIAGEAKRAVNILQNLARVAEGASTDSSAATVDLEVLVTDTLISAASMLERRGLGLATDLVGPLTAPLPNPDHLRNAVLDLLLYAAETASKGSTLSIAGRSSEGHARLSIGFTATAAGEMSGANSLVLAVATTAIEEQGGQLTSHSEGQSTRLDISLPLAGSPTASAPEGS